MCGKRTPRNVSQFLEGLLFAPRCPQKTDLPVDGSEIPRPTTWHVQNSGNIGRNNQLQLVSLPDFLTINSIILGYPGLKFPGRQLGANLSTLREAERPYPSSIPQTHSQKWQEFQNIPGPSKGCQMVATGCQFTIPYGLLGTPWKVLVNMHLKKNCWFQGSFFGMFQGVMLKGKFLDQIGIFHPLLHGAGCNLVHWVAYQRTFENLPLGFLRMSWTDDFSCCFFAEKMRFVVCIT